VAIENVAPIVADRERPDDRLGVVGGHRDDPLSRRDSEPLQLGGKDPHAAAQLASRQVLARAIDTMGHQRDALAVLWCVDAQQVLRVAQPHPREERCVLADIVCTDRLGNSLVDQIRPFEEQQPELPVFGDRERVECSVVGEPAPRPFSAEPHEGRAL
jgi:hypothetical protein